MSHSEPADNLEQVMNRVAEETDGVVRVDDVLAVFDRRVLGPVLLLPALVLLTPLGGIPGVPTAAGLILVLVAGQRLLGRPYPWVPHQLSERGVDHDRLCRAFDRARPWARRVDRLLKPRVVALVEGPMAYANALVVVLLGAMMPPLELVPFAVTIPAVAVLLLALGITAHDGVVTAAGWIAALGALALMGWTVF